MKRNQFTEQELAELAAADALIDDEPITLAEWLEANERDKQLRDADVDPATLRKRLKNRRYYHRHAHEQKRKHDEWVSQNREHVAEYLKRYKAEHKEEIAIRDRAYYEANKEKITEQRHIRYAENRDSINEQRRNQRAQNVEAARERDRAYYAAHKDEINARRRERYGMKTLFDMGE